MPSFGYCTSIDNAALVAEAGFDYLEPPVGAYLQGEASSADPESVRASVRLPMPVCNCLVPGRMKIVGAEVDREALREYMRRVLTRAGQVGVETLVFGSGGARMIPDDYDRSAARTQIVDFLKDSATIAAASDVMIVIEPLNRGECNVLNGVAESMEYVREVGHPNIKCLVDSYHHWLEDETLDDVAAAGGDICHVHVADRADRVLPMQAVEPNPATYEAFFGVLKKNGYDGRISIESAHKPSDAAVLQETLAKLKAAWTAA